MKIVIISLLSHIYTVFITVLTARVIMLIKAEEAAGKTHCSLTVK